MPDIEDMKEAVREIMAFCREQRSDFYLELYDQLDAMGAEVSDADDNRIEKQYRHAIHALLLVADPPHEGTLGNALSELNEQIDDGPGLIESVSVVDRADGDHDLKALLGPAPERTADEREIIAWFRHQISPGPEADPVRKTGPRI